MVDRIVSAVLVAGLNTTPAFAGAPSMRLGDIESLRGFSSERLTDAAAVPTVNGAAVVPVHAKPSELLAPYVGRLRNAGPGRPDYCGQNLYLEIKHTDGVANLSLFDKDYEYDTPGEGEQASFLGIDGGTVHRELPFNAGWEACKTEVSMNAANSMVLTSYCRRQTPFSRFLPTGTLEIRGDGTLVSDTYSTDEDKGKKLKLHRHCEYKKGEFADALPRGRF